MKKNLFMLALAMAAGVVVANAQIQRGNVMVGANLTDLKLTLSNGGSFKVDINPKAAWFITDNTALGAYLNFSLETVKHAGTNTSYGIGALVRQYMNGNSVPAVRHTRLFFEGNIGIEGTNLNPTGGNKTSTNGLGLGIGPGLAYFITPNIGLEGLVKYNGIVGFGTTATTSEINLGVGFQIYLPGRTVRAAATNSQ
jgi:hypothetical protein